MVTTVWGAFFNIRLRAPGATDIPVLAGNNQNFFNGDLDMKYALILMSLGLGLQAQAQNACFHLGKFTGTGSWIQKSEAGTHRQSYTVEGGILNNVYELNYHFGAESELVRFGVRCLGDGFFEVLDHSNEVVAGQGYCLEGTCHYSLVVPNGRVEETITMIGGGRARKTGSKVVEGENIAWSEDLAVVE